MCLSSVGKCLRLAFVIESKPILIACPKHFLQRTDETKLPHEFNKLDNRNVDENVL